MYLGRQRNAESIKLASTSLFPHVYVCTFPLWGCPTSLHCWTHPGILEAPQGDSVPAMKPDQRGPTSQALIFYHSCRKDQINIFINQVCRRSEHKLIETVHVVGRRESLSMFSQLWSKERYCFCASKLHLLSLNHYGYNVLLLKNIQQ